MVGSEIYDCLSDHERRIKQTETNIQAVMRYLKETGQLNKLTRRCTGSGHKREKSGTSADVSKVSK